MDRQLTVEFPWLALVAGGPPPAPVWEFNPATDTRQLSAVGYVQEMKLDLSGYVQDSLTVGFRRSFEQLGGAESIGWETYDANNDGVFETVIISSVPFNDNQLAGALASSPGFTPYAVAGVDWGNFNREHIIHGTYQLMYANNTIGAGAFNSKGVATLMSVQSNDFSSLEPTAADCLYCYRVFGLPEPGTAASGVSAIGLPAKRIILDAFTVEEPDLEYMMRLKRSYELANQV
jgi:hypothetical protein